MFLRFYGLNEQPFGVTPDPRFLHMGPAQQEAFSSLVYGIEAGRGFMALIASPGLGKTTILLQLMERLRESARTALLFETHANSLEFLRSLLADLGIEPSGRDLGELQRQLRDVLIQEAQAGKRIVVAIDEAQNLDDQILEMIRMLSNFETPQAKLLQIVLVGQPQLADKLASPHLEQLRQRVSIITHFPPLDGNDIPQYIDHRLRVAGYSGGSLFTPAALRLIVTNSKGIPRKINNLCFHALSLGYAKNQKKIDEATLREVIADLSLESLGTSPPQAPAKVPLKYGEGGGNSRKETPIGLKPPSSRAIKSIPIAHDDNSLLDGVDLSSSSMDGDVITSSKARRPTLGMISTGHSSKHTARPFVLIGLAALFVCLWTGSWLKSGFDSLKQFAGGGATSPKYGDVTPTPVSTPVVTGLPGVHAGSLENRSSLGMPASSNESPAPAASEAHSSAAAGMSSVVPGTKLSSPRKLSRTTSGLHAAHSPPDRGYAPGNGRLVVESSISRARITINGESNPKWITPRLFSLASGTYVVSVSSGASQTWTRRVHVDEGREQWIMAELEDQEEGIFTVDTDPPGMQVFIDGKAFGPSRVETVLHPGWHVCEVIPGPGLKALVSRFHMQPGAALTRRIRMETPAAPSGNDAQHRGSNAAGLTADPMGGTP